MTHGKAEGKDAAPRRNLTPFERLTDVARRLVAVPKSELPAQERAFQRAKKKRKRVRRVSFIVGLPFLLVILRQVFS